MERYFIFCWLLVLAIGSRGQSTGGVRDVQGRPIPLDSFPNKKLLIVILPATTDTAMTGQLLRFQHRHAQQVNIMVIVAPGAAPSTVDSSSSCGRLSSAGIWLTQGMGAGDSATTTRQSVLRYLSNKSRNRLVDHFAEGAKYFLSEKGRLFAQLGKAGSLDSRIADYIVQTHVPGEDRY